MIITEKFVLLNLPRKESPTARKAIIQLYGGLQGQGAAAGWEGAFIHEVRPRKRSAARQIAPPAEYRLPYHDLPPEHASKPALMVMSDPFIQRLSQFRNGLWAKQPPLPVEQIQENFPRFPELSFEDYCQFQDTLYLHHLLQGEELNADIGPRTLQVLKLLAADPDDLFARLSDDAIDTGDYLADLPPITLLRRENLNQELHDYLLEMDYPADRLAFILELEPGGPQAVGDQQVELDKYFTPVLKRQFRYRERALFNLYYYYSSPQTSAIAAPEIIERRQFGKVVRRAVERLVDPSGQAAKSPGMVVGVVSEEGTDVFGFGTMQLGEDMQPEGKTAFGIGSVTKVFTGLLLAKAVAEKGVYLDQPAVALLGDDIPLHPDITLRHLASHTSGLPLLPENLPDLGKDEISDWIEPLVESPGANYSRELLIHFLADEREKSISTPGGQMIYSSVGTGILGMALASQFGFGSFEELNEAWIASPLGLQDTGAQSPVLLRRLLGRQAQGYASNGSALRSAGFSDMGLLAGSGALISTADDMNSLLEVLTGIRKTPLEEAVIEARRPLASAGPAGDIGYAVRISSSVDGGKIYSKGGLVAGYTAFLAWRTAPRLGLVMLANHGATHSRFSLRGFNQTGFKLLELLARGRDDSSS
jgi:CubicO group peptidase (beta-lactamase class C family)